MTQEELLGVLREFAKDQPDHRERYRREVAKSVLAGFAADPNLAAGTPTELADLAAFWADALVKRLEKPKEAKPNG